MRYYVANNLRHDGRDFARGTTVDFSDEQAQPLLEAGVLSTEPIEATVVPASEEQEPDMQPKVGGQSRSTGEPTYDGSQESEPGEDNAKDVTPSVDSDSEDKAPKRRASRKKQESKLDGTVDPSANL